jgi:hypothetical protein
MKDVSVGCEFCPISFDCCYCCCCVDDGDGEDEALVEEGAFDLGIQEMWNFDRGCELFLYNNPASRASPSLLLMVTKNG